MYCFIDSNIWLYAFIEGQDREKTQQAQALIGAHEPVVSTQVVNEVCVNLIRQADFTEADIRELVASFYERYPVYGWSRGMLLRASRLRERYSLSFWDSHIVAAAFEADVGRLYSEDMQNGMVIEKQLEIVNPFEL